MCGQIGGGEGEDMVKNEIYNNDDFEKYKGK